MKVVLTIFSFFVLYTGYSQQDTIIQIVCHERAPLIITPRIRGCVSDTCFKENGYNSVYTENDKIWQDGQFRNGRLWEGKVYVYDVDGYLVAIKIFRNGVLISEEKL